MKLLGTGGSMTEMDCSTGMALSYYVCICTAAQISYCMALVDKPIRKLSSCKILLPTSSDLTHYATVTINIMTKS